MEQKSAQSRHLFVAAGSLVPVMTAISTGAAEHTAGGQRKQHKEENEDCCVYCVFIFFMYNVNATYTSLYEVHIGDVVNTTQYRPIAV